MKKKSICEADSYGNKVCRLNGRYHREDGPAFEGINGTKRWYLNGNRHREDGPAYEYADGTKEWYLNGIKYSEKEYWTKLFELGKITEEELFLKLL